VTEHAPTTISLSLDGPRGMVRATIDRVGASLNSAEVAGEAVVPGWKSDTSRPFCAGVTLAPWPNRIRDGKWPWQGKELQLEITEPGRQTALHGLVSDTPWEVVEQREATVTLSTRVDRAPGYPFTLEMAVTYRLNDEGVGCTIDIRNVGDALAPVAIGFHPFLCLGDRPVRSLTLDSPVEKVVVVDERLLPIGLEDVSQSTHNPAEGTPLHDTQFDTGFQLEGSSEHVTRLFADDGASVELWQSPELGWMQFFLTDDFPGPHGAHSALAVEPMSAPADAFNSGIDVWHLEPGEAAQASWGIRLG
jgi:aldose 1-epimerase